MPLKPYRIPEVVRVTRAQARIWDTALKQRLMAALPLNSGTVSQRKFHKKSDEIKSQDSILVQAVCFILHVHTPQAYVIKLYYLAF